MVSIFRDCTTIGILDFYAVLMNWHFWSFYHQVQVAQMVKYLLAMQETWVRSRGQEDPLENGMATHSGIPAWRIPWTEKPGGL